MTYERLEIYTSHAELFNAKVSEMCVI